METDPRLKQITQQVTELSPDEFDSFLEWLAEYVKHLQADSAERTPHDHRDRLRKLAKGTALIITETIAGFSHYRGQFARKISNADDKPDRIVIEAPDGEVLAWPAALLARVDLRTLLRIRLNDQ